jgi:hypothetical protein
MTEKQPEPATVVGSAVQVAKPGREMSEFHHHEVVAETILPGEQ